MTDDRLQLADTLAMNSGEMASALEAIGEVPARDVSVTEISGKEAEQNIATRADIIPDVTPNHDHAVLSLDVEPMVDRYEEPPPPTHEAEYGEAVRLERTEGAEPADRTQNKAQEPEKTRDRDIGMEMGL